MPRPSSTVTARPNNLQVCFSFAAYAKKLIDHLKFLHIPILPGLTRTEFSDLESKFKFSFPPDLHAILREGLPFGPNFPNWRSSSLHHLQILRDLPTLDISNNVRHHGFWVESWGPRPDDPSELNAVFDKLLGNAPTLVPIYRNCYIPALPEASGNPIFLVDEEAVRVLSFDIAGFFHQLQLAGSNRVGGQGNYNVTIMLPAWAATAAREIEFWTEAAKKGKRRKLAAADGRAATGGWWVPGGGGGFEIICCQLELTACMEEVFWRLRDGGWREEEVREMMMMKTNNNCDRLKRNEEEEDAVWHVRMLSAGELLRAGWSKEDVLYSLDLQDCCDQDLVIPEVGKKSSPLTVTLDFQIADGCRRRSRDDELRRNSLRDLLHEPA
ncbi:unnamed protein product [Linum trigynum]|uniref:Uncharacterized protein n=1 Tax=Linum trigynum TaxID=586398 RepID=A0AAV2DDJ0_9ROSI